MKSPGLPPGSPVYTGRYSEEGTVLREVRYSAKQFSETEVSTAAVAGIAQPTQEVLWIEVTGLSDVAALEQLKDRFNIHPLALEDCVHVDQRPKLGVYDDHLHFVIRSLNVTVDDDQVDSEQISLLLGAGYIITFAEHGNTLFNPVRERLRRANGRIRELGADYLFYSLIDAVVDNYQVVLEHIRTEAEQLEDFALDAAGKTSPSRLLPLKVHHLRRAVLVTRRYLPPTEYALNQLIEEDSSYLVDSTKIYLRDVLDHVVRAESHLYHLQEYLPRHQNLLVSNGSGSSAS